jgi:hypothetical protein
MAINLKTGAVKVGKSYIEAGAAITGLSKEEETSLVSAGAAEYLPAEPETPESEANGESPDDGADKKAGKDK